MTNQLFTRASLCALLFATTAGWAATPTAPKPVGATTLPSSSMPAASQNPFKPPAQTPQEIGSLAGALPLPAMSDVGGRYIGTVNGVSIYVADAGCYLYRENGRWRDNDCLRNSRDGMHDAPNRTAKH